LPKVRSLTLAVRRPVLRTPGGWLSPVMKLERQVRYSARVTQRTVVPETISLQ